MKLVQNKLMHNLNINQQIELCNQIQKEKLKKKTEIQDEKR
jgi:hypothetical protein